MDIHILCAGEQLGPCTEAAVREMLKEGKVSPTDLAWTAGRENWEPLATLLPNRPAFLSTAEPATPRQRAFLSYMGLPFAAETTRDEAARLVNDAMENPRDAERLSRWSEERLLLHPELFAAEIQARKENRAQRYLEIYLEQGTPFFDKVTKAHCQVLVGHLDVQIPRWDADEREAAWKYFFPALAEKFPQLATLEGKLKFASGKREEEPRPTRSATVKTSRGSSSSVGRTIGALARGIFLGLLVLGVLWFGFQGYQKWPMAVTYLQAKLAAPASAPSAPVAPVAPAGEAPVSEPAPAVADVPAPQKSEETPATTEPAAEAPVAAIPPAPAPAALAPPAPRTTVVLTKPMEVKLAYGKIVVPAGTSVQIVERNGVILTVRYLDKLVVIPASQTDLGHETAVPAVALPNPAPATTAANASSAFRE
jgi:hypothetical protein